MKLNHVILTVPDVTGWDDTDVAALTKWLNAYANLLGKNSEEQAVQVVRNALALEGDFPANDINRWFYTVISLIFYELEQVLTKQANKKQTNLLVKLKANFSPITDFAFSCFGNFMDDIDFEQSRDAIVAQAMKLINS
jgi:hypothetical protein